ncbi:MAG: hypothetical protein JWO67_5833 [Streptosporangiaceae bacterium]|jgi:hypothetical protein|nr:hypothetical protein [Streptosporangiaceae bacterium]
MARLPGDPGVSRRIRYAIGLRLPEENRGWVGHDLTDVGWRGRIVTRHLGVMIPFCLLLALLPGQWWLRVSVCALALIASTFVVAVSAGDLRRSRLRQHGLPVPQEREPQG